MSGIKAEGICSISYKAPAPTKSIDYEGAVAEAKRKRMLKWFPETVEQHTVAVLTTDWEAVWESLQWVKGDGTTIGALLDRFTTETQGKRVFRPRFSKD
jgi:hypothetical protein